MTLTRAMMSPRASAGPAEHEDRLLVALADSMRRRMLSLLSHADGTMCVFELVQHFDVAQPTISHHLRILTRANLVYQRKHGLLVYYYVNHDVLVEAQDIIARIGRDYDHSK